MQIIKPRKKIMVDFFFVFVCVCVVNLPKVIINHHSQLLSLDAKSVECCTMKVHLAKDSPKPDSAPYLDAIVWQKHINNKNPIQLKMKATENQKMSV